MREMPEVCAIVIDELVEQRHSKEMTQADLVKASELIQSVIARFDIYKSFIFSVKLTKNGLITPAYIPVHGGPKIMNYVEQNYCFHL